MLNELDKSLVFLVLLVCCLVLDKCHVLTHSSLVLVKNKIESLCDVLFGWCVEC